MNPVRGLRTWVEPTAFTRRVGGVHLALTGIVDAVTGAVLAYAALTGWLLDATYATLEWYVNGAELLQWGQRVAFLATDVAAVVGVVLVVVGGAQVLAGRDAFRGRRWRRSVALGAVGLSNPLALPVALVGLVCCVVAHDQFVLYLHRA